MKKIILSLITVLCIYGCKKSEETATTKPNDVSTSISSNNDSLIYVYARYLRDNEETICPTIEEEGIGLYHQVSDTLFNEMIQDFWGPKYNASNVPFQKIELNAIQKIMTSSKCYDEYIGFESDSLKVNVEINLKKLDTFTLKEPCYSKPLFRTLEQNLGLNGSSVFLFTKAKKNNRYTIIFKIADVHGVPFYYDLTDWPAFIRFIQKIEK